MGMSHARNTARSIASRAHSAIGTLAMTPIAMASTASNHPVDVRSLGRMQNISCAQLERLDSTPSRNARTRGAKSRVVLVMVTADPTSLGPALLPAAC